MVKIPISSRKLIIKNITFSVFLQAGTYVLGFITVPYLTRVLGPSAYGSLAYTITLNAFAWLAVDWGFSIGGTQKVAENRHDNEKLREIFWGIISAKTILAFIAFLFLICLSIFVKDPGVNITVVPMAIGLSGVLLSVDWFVQGFEKMGLFALTSIGGRAATLTLILIFVHRPSDLWIAAIIQAASGLLGSMAGLIVVRKLVSLGRPNIIISTGLRNIYSNRHFFLTNSNAVLYSSAAPMILVLVSGPIGVGLFASADKILKIAFALLSPVATALYPRTVALINVDRNQAARLAGRSLLLQIPFAILIFLTLLFCSGKLAIYVLGARMVGAASVLMVFSPLPVIYLMNRTITLQVLFPLGLIAESSKIVNISGFAYISLLVLLVKYMGVTGAAAAFTLTEAFQLALYIRLLWIRERLYFLNIISGMLVN